MGEDTNVLIGKVALKCMGFKKCLAVGDALNSCMVHLPLYNAATGKAINHVGSCQPHWCSGPSSSTSLEHRARGVMLR